MFCKYCEYLGKLELHAEFDQLSEILYDNDIELLPIAFLHVQKLLSLDFFHRDPFDRIIISQGLSENLAILTRDENFKLYGAEVVW
jgi:PIN domain nuclease of toxin-antitoxin system